MSIFRCMAFVTATVLLAPACALLKKPTPLTQLQLVLNATELHWPQRLELGDVKARGMLQTDRVIVTKGALVMQHGGLRWVAAPATLLAEQLAIARVATASSMPDKRQGSGATVNIWLADFNISVHPNGETSAAVSAWANVRCNNARTAKQVPTSAVALPLNSTDPQRIAERFDAAATQVLKALLAQAAEKSAGC